MAKKIAVYGLYETLVPVRQRYKKWVYHRKGPKAGKKWYKKRIWKIPKGRFKKAELKGRYEFTGKGKVLYKAVVLSLKYMPKGFVDVLAEDFIKHPQKYGVEGKWIEREIKS